MSSVNKFITEERIYTLLNKTYMCEQLQVTLPDYLGGKECYIDRDIVDYMQTIWKDKIHTLSCCSGHNLTAPSLIVENMDKKAIAELRLKLFMLSNQWWDIMSWELIKK